MKVARWLAVMAMVLAFAAGCRADDPAVVRDREVYGAVLDSLLDHRPLRLAVLDSTVAPPSADIAWVLRRDALPAVLGGRLAEVSRTRVPSTRLNLPRAATYYSRTRVERMMRELPTLPIPAWIAGPRDVVALSPIAYTDDHRQALVYAVQYCRGLCGMDGVVWLRSDGSGRWQVTRFVIFSIS